MEASFRLSPAWPQPPAARLVVQPCSGVVFLSVRLLLALSSESGKAGGQREDVKGIEETVSACCRTCD